MAIERKEHGPEEMNRKRYILIFLVSFALVIVAVCVYLGQLSATVAGNLMDTVHEISRHDVEAIEGALDNSYARLGSIAKRMEVYDVQTMEEAQEQLNLEAASSALFNAVYLLADDGTLYSSTYVRLAPDSHAYDEMFADGREHFVMLYDDANGRLETTRESIIYGMRLDDMKIGDHTFVGMIGRGDLTNIRDQLLIESFEGEGVSSVINSYGYYIVSDAPVTDLAGRDNFYATLEMGRLEDGMTLEQVRENVAEGKSFIMSYITPSGEPTVLSFAPVEDTAWSYIMTVPTHVFEQRFAPFMALTVGMLIAVILVLIVMTAIIYGFMKSTVSANAKATARAEFLSNMSHEIRTPLNGIIGLNHLMERHLDDEKAMKTYVRKLGQTAQYLLSLVNDILDVSKLQAGKVELDEGPFDLRTVIESVCEMQREPMEAGGIRFVMEAEGLEYPYLLGDDTRISQVLMNILSNAVKFTPPEGTITFRVTQAASSIPNWVITTISIADTGIGMTPEFRQRIFDNFSQERNSNRNSQKGTGLGMSISNLLVKQMNGELSVESELGLGSCFTVMLSLLMDPDRRCEMPIDAVAANTLFASVSGEEREGAATATVLLSEEASASDQLPLKVLIAEDNELNADILSSILTEEGYDVTVVTDGQQAVNAFAMSDLHEFAAILMDAQMPVLDGYDAAREIRRLGREDAETVKIFACTASTFAEDRNRALESGMDDFLSKPLNVPAMLEKLEQVRKEGGR